MEFLIEFSSMPSEIFPVGSEVLKQKSFQLAKFLEFIIGLYLIVRKLRISFFS